MERAAIHAYLTQEAHGSLRDFAVANGVSMSALLEAFGRDLGGSPTSIKLSALVEDARAIDGERRVRSPRG